MKIDFRQILSALILISCVCLILRLFLKRKIRTAKIKRWWRILSDKFHEHQFLKVPEFNDNFQENHLFRQVSLYLNSLESLEDSNFINLFSGLNPTDILLSMNPNQSISDHFLGAHLSWHYQVVPNRSLNLQIRKRDKRRVLRPYLQHIHSVSNDIEHRVKEIRLYTNTTVNHCNERWRSVPFTHPATMDTVAMDPELKNRIKTDLETFLKSKPYYHRLGRVWRRSYLLYGPSGTGKSSFVAAMAKSLNYDVYDIDFSKVTSDSDLKLLLLQTTPRSLILVEDFDRYVGGGSSSMADVTVTGILNFMDGVVNSCCDERVMVFTMTRKDNIDPAILRPGRVDVHIHFPMCDFSNFRNLAVNYLGVKEHKLFPQVEEIFQSGATLSPAEIGELMMANRSSPSRALKSVISALQTTSSSPGPVMGTPKNGGLRSGRVSVDESGDPGEGIGCRDGVKEIRKLYGLLRRKSFRQSGSFDSGGGNLQ